MRNLIYDIVCCSAVAQLIIDEHYVITNDILLNYLWRIAIVLIFMLIILQMRLSLRRRLTCLTLGEYQTELAWFLRLD